MAMGFVLTGMLVGMLAGALIAGAGIWVALAAYSGGGAAGVLMAAALAVLPRPAMAGGVPSHV